MVVAGIETPHCKLKTGDRAALLFYKNYWVISDKCIFDATISRSYVLCGATYRRYLSCRKSEKMSSRPDWGAASLLNLFKRYFQQEYFLKE